VSAPYPSRVWRQRSQQPCTRLEQSRMCKGGLDNGKISPLKLQTAFHCCSTYQEIELYSQSASWILDSAKILVKQDSSFVGHPKSSLQSRIGLLGCWIVGLFFAGAAPGFDFCDRTSPHQSPLKCQPGGCVSNGETPNRCSVFIALAFSCHPLHTGQPTEHSLCTE
jgi:hypothetical protein